MSEREKLLVERRKLPVWEARAPLLARIAAHDVTIVVGETGSGKTTQIPQFLLEEHMASSRSGERVAVTQPRRVAAVAVAALATVAVEAVAAARLRLAPAVGLVVVLPSWASAALQQPVQQRPLQQPGWRHRAGRTAPCQAR